VAFVVAEKLPEATFDAIALDSVPETLLDDHAETMVGKLTAHGIDQKMPGPVSFAPLFDAAEIAGVPQSFPGLQTMR
jgi:hypothetical protein